jgi:hypothetical protein
VGNHNQFVTLPAAHRGSKARAKCPDEKRDENPKRRFRDCLSSIVRSSPRCQFGIGRNAFCLSVYSVDAQFCILLA